MARDLPLLRALVVEDDPSWQQILSEILSDCGLAVDLAVSYEEAVTLIRAAPHRIAVLDLSLGGPDHRNQDGLKVLEAVTRQDPGCASIFLTGFATVELAVSVIQELGAYTCLRKETFRRADFRKVVNQALAAVPAAASEAGPGAPVGPRGAQMTTRAEDAQPRQSSLPGWPWWSKMMPAGAALLERAAG